MNFNSMASFFGYTAKHKKAFFCMFLFFVAFGIFLPTAIALAAPTITRITPNPAVTKSNGVFSSPLIIYGTGFNSDSIVKIRNGINGSIVSDQITTWRALEPDKLETNKLNDYNPGTYPVIVVDKASGETSNAVNLVIEPHKEESFFESLLNFFGNFWETLGEHIIILPVKWFSYLLVKFSFYFADISADMFKYILANFVNNADWSITRIYKSPGQKTFAGSVFVESWNTIKGWANMLIVLGLIGVALATILNFQEYAAKKLLVPIIITALLINFSIVFVGLMIDASNILTTQLVGDSNKTIDVVRNIDTAWNNVVKKLPEDGRLDNTNKAAFNILFALIYIVIGLTFLGLTLIFVQRYIWLAILFIFSPLAFVFRVFPNPSAKKIWSDWWHNFIKWCFAGVMAAFFIGLASRLITALQTNSKNIFMANKEADLVGVFVLVLLILGFLIAGLRAAQKSNVIANIVMSATAAIIGAIITGGASLAASAAGAAGIGALRKTGVAGKTRATVDAISDNKLVNWARDKIGGTGTSATARQKKMQERLKEPTSRLENIRDNKELAKVATSGITAAERAAATNILKSRDSLDKIPAAERQRAMNNAINHDNKLKVSDFAKSDYRYVAFDNRALDRIQLANPGWTPDTVRRAAVQEQLETNLPSMSGNQRRNIDREHITPQLVTSKAFNANVVRNFKIADRPQIDALKHITVKEELLRIINDPETTRGERSRLTNILNEINDLDSP